MFERGRGSICVSVQGNLGHIPQQSCTKSEMPSPFKSKGTGLSGNDAKCVTERGFARRLALMSEYLFDHD